MHSFRIPTSMVVFTTSALLGCASALSLAWPGILHADDGQPGAATENEAELPPGTTRFGEVAATISLETNEQTGQSKIHLLAINTAEQERFVKLDVCLERYEFVPMSRSGGIPELAWTQTAKLVVPAGDRYERSYSLPPDVAKAILAAKRAAAQPPQADDEEEPRVVTAFEVSVREPEAAAAG